MSEVNSINNLSSSYLLYPTGLFLLNQNGEIFYVNEVGLGLISLKGENILKKSFFDFLDENDKIDFQGFFQKASNSPEPQITEINIKGVDGNFFHALLTAKRTVITDSPDKFCSLSVVDLTSLKMREALIKQSEARFEKMANTAPVMIWIADVEGLFSFVNSVWLEYTGKKIGDQLGMNWLKNVHPDDFEKLLKVYQEAFKSREPFSAQFRFKGIDEQFKWMLIKGTPRLNDEGKFTGFIGSCVNINEQMENEEKIKKINADLAESNETKDKFFSIIAHDLRGPLSGLSQILEILVTDYEDMEEDEKMEIVTEASKASNSTYALIENLLEWSRIQSGRLLYEPTKFNLFNLINNIEALYNQNIKKKGITIKVEVNPEVTVFADKKMTETIIRNLISNAIKFTPQNGSIVVNSEADQNYSTIKVQDTGVGMEQKTMDKLFRIDVSHSTPGTGGEAGTGLGLILSKELVEKQGGKIWVESKLNEGSSFYFTLPVSNRL
jgi:PAS domain S-box-containing protein